MASEAHSPTSNSKRHSTSELINTVEKEAKPLQQFFTKFNNDWSMNFSGVLAYSLLMAMLPIAIALLAITGLILHDPAMQDKVINQVTHVFPGMAAQQNALKLASRQLDKASGFLSIVAVVLAIFGGSRLFIAMEGCLNIVYRVRPRPVIRQNLMAIGMLLLFIILVPIMVFASAIPTAILAFLSNMPQLARIPFFSAVLNNPIIAYVAGFLGGIFAAFLLFEAIYTIIPNQAISWRNSWRGALIAAVAMGIFLTLFPIYIRFFLGGYAGQIGFAVILLLFFYYFAVILMLGAEVNAFFFEGVRPLPNDLATFVSTMAGTLNHDFPTTEAQHHTDSKPTEHADRAHIMSQREQEKEVQQKNKQLEREIAASHLAHQKSETKEKKSKGPSKMTTALEVVVGSAIAMGIELLRLRRK